ncbi:hypothetical protein LV83_01179 [Algoriphagus yeomjeoni]|uniref:Uncharacterized protein n=1 Tax=Algoriphagus yeomjeoni TaxID=291403 RepID=A0A327PL17_9BACT|nr:hypothetical protein LV83_01179 [Algoriphagus yeomjeoni]
MDLESEQYACRDFDVIKNVYPPNCTVQNHLYQANFIFEQDYEFEKKLDLPVECGVHNPPVSFIILNYFLNNYGVYAKRYINLIHPRTYMAPNSSMSNGIMV